MLVLIGLLGMLSLALLFAGANNNAVVGWRSWIPFALVVVLSLALWAAGKLH